MKAIGRFIRTVLILLVIVIGGAIAYAFSGHYDVSVGSGHMPWTQWYLETVRSHSIRRRAADIDVPELGVRQQVSAGAGAYNQAGAGCHGRPGRPPSDSFDPPPPALTRGQPDPAGTFWVVRNGIKMSAMPAVGRERVSDEELWALIAFLQTASSLTEGEYRELVEPAEPEPEPEPDAEPALTPDQAPDSEDGTESGQSSDHDDDPEAGSEDDDGGGR